ncbi:MAG: complex I NDUFA9 subunit family protein [Rhizobiaceae bacterium]|jgi:NADH dehydrogenase|nr:complex I NDUFA9 subunit family protein [Rhizobiaceae bacterium]
MAQPKLVTVFGGSGFVGRHVVAALAKRGYNVRAAVRRPDLAGHLQPLGTVGQIHAVQANLRFRWSVDRAVEGADHVVNLVGILYEGGRQTFDAVQSFGARAIAEAARNAGAGLTHVSAIGADADSAAAYARTKAEAEQAVLATVPSAVILRPSIIFGPEDNFFNQFAGMARIAPALPLIGGGVTKFQPVYVRDVAEAVALSVDGALKPGATYELGGPDVKSFRECLELVLSVTGRKRPFVTIPFWAAKIQGSILGLLPKPLLTKDQVVMLETDNVVSDAAMAEGRTLQGMGITPTTAEAILPTYLWRFRETGQYQAPTAGGPAA